MKHFKLDVYRRMRCLVQGVEDPFYSCCLKYYRHLYLYWEINN